MRGSGGVPRPEVFVTQKHISLHGNPANPGKDTRIRVQPANGVRPLTARPAMAAAPQAAIAPSAGAGHVRAHLPRNADAFGPAATVFSNADMSLNASRVEGEG